MRHVHCQVQSRRLLLARWILILATSRAAIRMASLTSLACGLSAAVSMKLTNLRNVFAGDTLLYYYYMRDATSEDNQRGRNDAAGAGRAPKCQGA